MSPEEYLYCIKEINPLAHVVIWGFDVDMRPEWDNAHVGPKPTLQNCEAVLPAIRSRLQAREMDKKKREAALERLIAKEMKNE